MPLASDRRPPILSSSGGSGSAAPSGPAGGDLSGTYPDPSVVNDSHDHTGATLSGITDASIAAANKDGAASTPSLRTLGTGALQACAGNDSRLHALSAALPQALGAAAAGTTGEGSDAGHVHALPTATQVGAVPSPVGATTGDMLYHTGATWTRLPIGTADQILKVAGGIPTWGSIAVLLYNSGVVNVFTPMGLDTFFLPGAGTAWA